MEIKNWKEREEAVKAIAEFDRKQNEFEVGGLYQWIPGLAWRNQGKRHGPLRCVYVGRYQGLFDTDTHETGAFENREGLHIIARQHLRDKTLVRLD